MARPIVDQKQSSEAVKKFFSVCILALAFLMVAGEVFSYMQLGPAFDAGLQVSPQGGSGREVSGRRLLMEGSELADPRGRSRRHLITDAFKFRRSTGRDLRTSTD